MWLKLLLVLFLVISTPAFAQEVPNHAIPIGRGAGVVGWGSLACSVLSAISQSNASTDPICAPFSGTSTTIGSVSGTLTPGHCLSVDADHNIIDNGACQVTGNHVYACKQADAFYCSGAGSDTGNCTTPATACLTIFYATRKALQMNAGGYDSGPSVTVHIGDGNWSESVFAKGCPIGFTGNGGNYPCLEFNGNGAANTIWDSDPVTCCGTVIAQQFTHYAVTNMTIKDTHSFGILYADLGGRISAYDITFGAAHYATWYAEDGGEIRLDGNVTVNGGGTFLMNIGPRGSFFGANFTITFSGSPTFNILINIYDLSYAFLSAFSGAVGGGTGAYAASLNSVINTFGTGCTNLPGYANHHVLLTGAVCQ